jgi:hypothetical protein
MQIGIQLEQQCEGEVVKGQFYSCHEGIAYQPNNKSRRPCGKCGGTGYIPTTFGEEVLELIAHQKQRDDAKKR